MSTQETASELAREARELSQRLSKRYAADMTDLATAQRLKLLVAELELAVADDVRRLNFSASGTWAKIGQTLGISGQAAQQRFSRR